MKKIVYSICAAAMLCAASCGGSGNTGQAAEEEVSASEMSPLGKWRIARITAAGGFEKTTDPADSSAYITFAPDSTVNCYAGCNYIGGAYIVAGDSIRFDYMIRTEKACADMELEDSLCSVMSRVVTFDVAGDSALVLTAPDASIELKRIATETE